MGIQVIVKCKTCGHEEKRELKVGDVVIPNDGSGMTPALHHCLWNGVDVRGFKPVRILSIQGYMLAVIPASWKDDPNKRYHDMFVDNDSHLYQSSSWIWSEELDQEKIPSHSTVGFWIDSRVSALQLYQGDKNNA